jgi:hypothetical protein
VSQKPKLINRKGGRALKIPPVAGLSEGARLKGWLYAKVAKKLLPMI